jgi:hypothetical protein
MASTKAKIKTRGNRQEVWNGRAIKTPGGLKKEDLILNKRGKLVSKKMSESAKLRYPKLKAALCNSEQKEIENEVAIPLKKEIENEVVIPLKKEIENEVVIPLKKEIKPKKAKPKKVVTKAVSKKEIENEVVIPLKKEIKPKKAKTKKTVTKTTPKKKIKTKTKKTAPKKVITEAAPKKVITEAAPKEAQSEKLPTSERNLQYTFMSDLIYRLPEISQYQQLNLSHPERLTLARTMLGELIDLPFTHKYPNRATNTLARMLMKD